MQVFYLDCLLILFLRQGIRIGVIRHQTRRFPLGCANDTERQYNLSIVELTTRGLSVSS